MADGGGDELDRQVEELLATFDLPSAQSGARWRAQLRDLRRILGIDYCAAVRAMHARGRLTAAALLHAAQRDFPELNRTPLVFDAAMRAHICQLGIRLRMRSSPRHGPLRAFYSRFDELGPIIWLNLAHPPGAVAASLGHELGHWYHDRLFEASAAKGAKVFFNSNFAQHFEDPAELFADLFPVLAAYPRDLALRIFPTRGWRATLAQMDRRILGRVRAYLRGNYGFDTPDARNREPPRRLYYITSMVHFARLRWALLRELDV